MRRGDISAALVFQLTCADSGRGRMRRGDGNNPSTCWVTAPPAQKWWVCVNRARAGLHVRASSCQKGVYRADTAASVSRGKALWMESSCHLWGFFIHLLYLLLHLAAFIILQLQLSHFGVLTVWLRLSQKNCLFSLEHAAHPRLRCYTFI